MSEPDLSIDTSGQFCPVPIVEIAKAIKAVAPGQVVELVATDPGAEGDLAAWCRATKNELLALTRDGKVLRALVRKG